MKQEKICIEWIDDMVVVLRKSFIVHLEFLICPSKTKNSVAIQLKVNKKKKGVLVFNVK